MGLQKVAAVVGPGVAMFELGVVCEVFGRDRTEMGVPLVDFVVCAAEPGEITPCDAPVLLQVDLELSAAADADLVVIPAHPAAEPAPDAVLEVLRAAVERGARVLSVCSGAFVLGQAGLLDGRSCTTHWMYTDELARQFPLAQIDPDVLYVHDGPVTTSAGSAAGIDACLSLIREHQGASVATTIARRMVVPPHRDGGQAQYIDLPIPDCAGTGFGVLTDWVAARLEEDLSVNRLAEQMRMSPRTFARRFRSETGATPAAWVAGQRMQRARELLERTDLSIEEVARRSGFGTSAVLRARFAEFGTSPRAYRRTFAAPTG